MNYFDHILGRLHRWFVNTEDPVEPTVHCRTIRPHSHTTSITLGLEYKITKHERVEYRLVLSDRTGTYIQHVQHQPVLMAVEGEVNQA